MSRRCRPKGESQVRLGDVVQKKKIHDEITRGVIQMLREREQCPERTLVCTKIPRSNTNEVVQYEVTVTSDQLQSYTHKSEGEG